MGSRGSLIVATHVGPMFRETNDKAHKVVSAQCKKASRDKWLSQHLVKCIVRWDVAPVLPETSLYLCQATPGQNPRRMLRKPETSYRLFWRASYFMCDENELKTTSYSTMERDNSEAQHDDNNKIVPKHDRQWVLNTASVTLHANRNILSSMASMDVRYFSHYLIHGTIWEKVY